MTDVGRAEKLHGAGIQPVGHTIPATILPQGLPEARIKALQRKLKPDALLIADDGRGRTRAWVVEVKYCRDTDRTAQEARAQEQHRELQQLLAQAGHQADLVTLTVGVGGTIYNDTNAKLQTLGVSKEDAAKALTEAHLYSARWVRRMMAARTAAIAASQHTRRRRSHPGGKRTASESWQHPQGKRRRVGSGRQGPRRTRNRAHAQTKPRHTAPARKSSTWQPPDGGPG
jgi:hypothetical protein